MHENEIREEILNLIQNNRFRGFINKNEIELDSLDAVDLWENIDKKFNIEISDVDFWSCFSENGIIEVNNLVALIKRYL